MVSCFLLLYRLSPEHPAVSTSPVMSNDGSLTSSHHRISEVGHQPISRRPCLLEQALSSNQCLNAFSRSLLHANLQVHIRHVGDVQVRTAGPVLYVWNPLNTAAEHPVLRLQFKGISSLSTVLSICSARFSLRTFPVEMPSAKATLVAPGKGLSYVVMLL